MLPEAVQKVIDSFLRMPGIGPKTASRLTFFLLHSPENLTLEIAEALNNLRSRITYCQRCFNITDVDEKFCKVCADTRRQAQIVCVVEEPLDIVAIEKTGAYQGCYHVLHGLLSPIEGVGPEDLKIKQLIERVKAGGIEELILATNPSVEGDATAMYLQKQLTQYKVHITRLARGLPMGGDLEYADPGTLMRALSGRQTMN